MTLQGIKYWGALHHKPWMDPLRIAFGLALLFKGLYYIYNSDYAILWLQSGLFLKEAAGALSIILAFLHIFLGLFILLGILTRFASVVLVPVLLIGVAFANPSLTNPLEILFSIMALALCVFFFIEGSGKFSLYAYMSNPKTSPENMTTGEDDTVAKN
jgi:putative oxidoreductase